MIKGLKSASMWSEDLSRKLLPFYRDTVGLPVALEVPGFVVLGDQAGATLNLGTHSEVKGNASDPYRHIVGLEVDDCRAETARLKAAGVEFIEEPNSPAPGITIATFRDPEGNLVSLFQPSA
jgi:predicted enzyme related to lactoylglutathione lyase